MKQRSSAGILTAGLLTLGLLAALPATAQNVGIGTTTPKSKLSVNGSTASGGMAIGDATYTSTTGTVAPLNGAIIQGFTGIGTTAPLFKLHLEGNGSANWDSAIYLNSTANPPTGTFAPHVVLRASNNAALNPEDIFGRNIVQSLPGGVQANATGWDAIHRGFSGGAPLTAMRFVTSGGAGAVERMRIAEDGDVGIGTTNPLAPLHVLPSTGSFTRGAGSVHNFIDTGESLTNGNPAVSLPAMSIYANGRIVSGSGVFAEIFQAASNFTTSDRRIKNIIGVSDGTKDLETLQRIQITDYTMKDASVLGGRAFKKVIAQEVESVYPQAVSKTEKAIPDVMQRATAKEISRGEFQLSLAKEVNLKAGELIEIRNKDLTPEVVSIKSVEGNAITVALAYVKGGEEVFVYGRQVNDFGVVDYEALAMLNVSATQELAKNVAALKAENAELRARTEEVAELRSENEKLKNQTGQLAARLEALEKSMAATGTRPTSPAVALTTN